MRYVYEVNQEKNSHIDIGTYDSYGINVYVCVNDRNMFLMNVPDLFLDEHKALEFAKLCNEEQLELVHLSDVIEDILSDREMLA